MGRPADVGCVGLAAGEADARLLGAWVAGAGVGVAMQIRSGENWVAAAGCIETGGWAAAGGGGWKLGGVERLLRAI